MTHLWKPWAIFEMPDGTLRIIQRCDRCNAGRHVQAKKINVWSRYSKPSRPSARCSQIPIADEPAENCIDMGLAK